MTYRVVQWTTGNVGKSSVRAVAANPLLRVCCAHPHGQSSTHILGEVPG